MLDLLSSQRDARQRRDSLINAPLRRPRVPVACATPLCRAVRRKHASTSETMSAQECKDILRRVYAARCVAQEMSASVMTYDEQEVIVRAAETSVRSAMLRVGVARLCRCEREYPRRTRCPAQR